MWAPAETAKKSHIWPKMQPYRNCAMEKSPKLFLTDVRPNPISAGAPPQTPLGAYSAPQTPRGYSLRGPTCKERRGKGRDDRGGVEWSRRWMAPFSNS